MNETPIWFWVIGIIVVSVSIVLEIRTRRSMNKERE